MNARTEPPAADEPYSPRLRTAVVLPGTGTGGAYQAGVLRALEEAGVKIDLVAGHGVGAVGALFAAVDGTERLWDDKGFWRAAAVRSLYPLDRVIRLAFWAAGLSLAVVAVPVLIVALGLIVFPIDFVAKLVGFGGAGGLAAGYLRLATAAFAPEGLPTWLPRLVLLVLGAATASLGGAAWIESRGRRVRGPMWWRVFRPPLSAKTAVDHCWRVLWELVRGAARLKQPAPLELARRYVDLLAENLGQPGFRELVLAVHDLDARRDLVLALLAEPRRRLLRLHQTTADGAARTAEAFDLHGVARDYLVDAMSAALTVPVACSFHPMAFAPDSYWRGETHRLCDRPGLLLGLLDELTRLGVEQAIVVSAAPGPTGPHTLRTPRLDPRGRLGGYLLSAESAIVRDGTRSAVAPRLFVLRPDHNPLGPFDFRGGYDERSDRRQSVSELMSRGYEDAYRQFIEPVVGASGDRVGVP
jgi:hypothetical protein